MSEEVAAMNFNNPSSQISQDENLPKEVDWSRGGLKDYCMNLYMTFFNHEKLRQGKQYAIIGLILGTLVFSFLYVMIRGALNKKSSLGAELRLYCRYKNIGYVVTLFILGLITIDYGTQAVPFFQYVDTINNIKDNVMPDWDNLPPFTPIDKLYLGRECYDYKLGGEIMREDGIMDSFIFCVLAITWTAMYVYWFITIIILELPKEARAVFPAAAADKAADVNKAEQVTMVIDPQSTVSFGRRRRKWR